MAVCYLLQSGRHIVNFLPGGAFSNYKTAERIWLRILSVPVEEELKVLDLLDG